MGIASCLGNDLAAVDDALRCGRSGVVRVESFADLGMRSTIAGVAQVPDHQTVHRRHRRFFSDLTSLGHHAAAQAISTAMIPKPLLQGSRTGVVAGSGIGSSMAHHEALETARLEGLHKVSPFIIPKIMSSALSATISTTFGLRGVNYSISSACATSAHCIGHAMDLIRSGRQDLVLAGGAEELGWTVVSLFDAMGALSTSYNGTPERASRPYDRDRDGFVVASGAGMVVLEEREQALHRGAPILAELVGYGASSDGGEMLVPSAEGAAAAMNEALDMADCQPDYINTHATSTPIGDLIELDAMRQVFGLRLPPYSSTKSLTGHPIGASGVHELIYTILMMRGGYIVGSSNIERIDEAATDSPPTLSTGRATINIAMSNSFGFGGTNASLMVAAVR